MSNQSTPNYPDLTNTPHGVQHSQAVAPVPRAVEVAGSLDSPFLEALNAFEARWDLFPRGDDFQLWEPDSSPGETSIGIALPDAPSDHAVRISLHADDRVRISDLDSGSPVDLAATSRRLQLPAYEVREVLRAVVDALHSAQAVARLAAELRSARDSAASQERRIDHTTNADGSDAARLKNPQAQRADVATWEAKRDRFAADHGLTGVVASGLDDQYGLAMDIAVLTDEQTDLRRGGLAGWLSTPGTPRSDRHGIARVPALLYRLVTDVVDYYRHVKDLEKSLAAAHERQRIANRLEVLHERLADAENLAATRAEVRSLHQALVGAVKKAATPDQTPSRPAIYITRTGARPSRTQQPAPTPTAPAGPARRTGTVPPGL
jgi:hypothetical protein